MTALVPRPCHPSTLLRVRAAGGSPAVDREDDARDEASLAGQQVRHRVGDLGRASPPAQRGQWGQLLPRLGRRFPALALARQQGLVPLGIDRAESDGVDPDAIRSVVDGRGAGQAFDGRLGRGVGQGTADRALGSGGWTR
jgi:hypothetical protein